MHENLIAYLASCGLESENQSPDAPVPSRNQTFLVRDGKGKRLLVKRSHIDGPIAMTHEGQTIIQLASLASEPNCPLILPEVHSIEPRLGLLVLGWLDGGEALNYYHWRTGRYPLALGMTLGRALGWLHRESRALRPSLGPQAFVEGRFGNPRPFVYLTLDNYARLSQAGLRFFEMIHSDDNALYELYRLLQYPTELTLLHGDVKLPNLLRLRGRKNQIAFVDWEMARWGDPARDVGALFAQYIRAWLAPQTQREKLDQAGVCQFLRVVLNSYRRQRGSAYPLERDFRYRAIRWAGVSLLYYVFGAIHNTEYLDERHSSLTQQAIGMLNDPYRWAWILLEAA
ncbi:MAG TPA: hypothetical protein DD435_13725 [Cyanobacteria bacterium UBA8530]|nr:hypothetical protein [Cyanobacteria bacterium UBA8530]